MNNVEGAGKGSSICFLDETDKNNCYDNLTIYTVEVSVHEHKQSEVVEAEKAE